MGVTWDWRAEGEERKVGDGEAERDRVRYWEKVRAAREAIAGAPRIWNT